MIPYTVTTVRADGQSTTFYRLVTTLLDHRHAPAEALAACYRERWQDETGLADLKTRQLSPGTVLRSHSPDGVDQVIAAHLTVYQALRHLAYRSAEHASVPCQRISFTAVRETVIRHLTSNAAPTTHAHHTAWHQARKRSPTGYSRKPAANAATTATSNDPSPATPPTAATNDTPPAAKSPTTSTSGPGWTNPPRSQTLNRAALSSSDMKDALIMKG